MRPSLDYLTPEETDDHENRQKFKIERAPDPNQCKNIRTRLESITDGELTDGARNLFTFLLDLALNPRVNDNRRGQIAISTTKLGEWLSRSERAIYGWTKELVAQRHIWVSKLYRPNTKPMNVYHITKLQPMREPEHELARDGLWGNGYRRPDQVMPQGARGATCKKRQVILDAFGKPVSSKTLENAVASSKKCWSPPQNLRVAPAQNDTWHPQNLRGTPAQNDTSPPQNLRVAPAQNDSAPRQETAVFIESQLETETPVQKGEGVSHPPEEQKAGIKDQKWERWLATLDDMFPSKLDDLRSRLQAELKAVESDPKNVDLAGAPLKEKSEAFLDRLRKEIVELEAFQSPEAKQLLAQKQREATRFLSNPANYQRLALLPGAQATVELLTRKISTVNEYLEGPSV
jgi:hypothetical protein